MSTLLQKELAQNIVKNAKRTKKLNKKELLVSSGYSELSASQSSKFIIEQKGVKEELAILGFDEQTAKQVVGEILRDKNNEPQHRLKAADMVFDVFGSKAPDKSINLNVNAEEMSNLIKDGLNKFRGSNAA